MKLRSLLCFAAAIPLGILRIFVIKTSVEVEKGFYVRGAVLPYVFTVLCLAALVLFAAVSLSFRKKKYAGNLSGGAFALVGTAVFALALLCCGISTILSGNIILGTLGVIGGASLIIGAPAHVIPGKEGYLPVCMLIPCVWGVYNLITVFRRFSTIVTISDYLLQVLSLTALLLFVFYAAKLYNDGGSSVILHFSAYAVFLGVLVTALPALYFALTREVVFCTAFTSDLAVLASMLIYAPSIIYTVDKNEI